MKNTIITLTAIALFTASCGQTGTGKKVQKELNNEFDTELFVEADEYIDDYSVDEYEGEIPESFVNETDWDGADCDYYDESNTQYCRFPNANLQQVYNIIKKMYPILKSDLPADDIDYSTNGVDVKYMYSGLSLYILLDYGDNITIICIQDNYYHFEETESWITHTVKGDCENDTDWKGAKCKYYELSDLHGAYEIIFPKANLQQVYDIVKKQNSRLKSELPATDVEYAKSEDNETLKYRYISEKYLIIELNLTGGDFGNEYEHIEIIEKENETKYRLIYKILY
jgi:hypothetical protein